MKKQFLPLNLQFFADDPAGDPTPKSGDKTFSQDDVNRIVGERLSREKAKYDDEYKAKYETKEVELKTRETELNKRELRYKAADLLSEKNLPNELLEVLNYSSEEEMCKNIEVLQKAFSNTTSEKKVPTITIPSNTNPKPEKSDAFLKGLKH